MTHFRGSKEEGHGQNDTVLELLALPFTLSSTFYTHLISDVEIQKLSKVEP